MPQRALYGCTDIYTVDVAYFAHCGIRFFEIKFKFTFLCKKHSFLYVINGLNLGVKHTLYWTSNT